MEGSLVIPRSTIRSFVNYLSILAIVYVSFELSNFKLGELLSGLPNSISLIKEMIPPDFSDIPNIIRPTLETLSMGFWGTLIGMIISLPLGILSAKNTSFTPVYQITRTIVNILRSIPELLYALIFVVSFGMEPISGVLALIFHTVGLLSKFYSEAIESIDRKPVEAIESTGSGKLGVIRYAIIPQVFPLFVGYTLYLLDHNIRVAMVLGLVGAGGLGIELFTAMRSFDYQKALAIISVLLVVISFIDRLSAKLRKEIIEGSFMSIRTRKKDSLYLLFFGFICLPSIYFIPIDHKMLLDGLPRLYEFFQNAFPPDLKGINNYLKLMLENGGDERERDIYSYSSFNAYWSSFCKKRSELQNHQ